MPQELATLTCNGRTFTFPVNPNEVQWGYVLNTNVEETYGGRVVQILSVKIEEMTIKGEIGKGGWEGLNTLTQFMTTMLVEQKMSQKPGVFFLPSRNWRFSVYATSLPIRDTAVNVSYEYEMKLQVQEDISQLVSTGLKNAEISRLKEGIGYEKNDYNYIEDIAPVDAGLDGDPDAEDESTDADGNPKTEKDKKPNELTNELLVPVPTSPPPTVNPFTDLIGGAVNYALRQ